MLPVKLIVLINFGGLNALSFVHLKLEGQKREKQHFKMMKGFYL